MSPRQAFEILVNIPEPRRTLVLTDAATALRVSEILGLMSTDVDFESQIIQSKRAYVWTEFKMPKSKSITSTCPDAPRTGRFLVGLARKNSLWERW